MKRTLVISLAVLTAVCLFRASNLLNAAHAQEGRGPVTHRINPDNGVANSVEEPGAPDTDHGAPARIGDALTTGGTGVVTPAITYHGGPLIQTPHIYIIWYGNWNQGNGSDTPAGQQIVRDFANSIGGSPYFQLNTTYSAGGYSITGSASFSGETTDTGSQGTRLSDNRVFSVVTNAINTGKLPYDQAGVYFVLTSSNISESSGFCSRYCGWHTAGNNTNGARIRFSFVGNANRCLSSCAAQTTSPNGNAGVDGAISVMAHELEEATTDPDLNAWYDSGGAENADKCAWTFGHAQYQTANGSWANMALGSRNYLIQRNLQHNVSGDLCKVNATQN
jgi:hypothetical protein